MALFVAPTTSAFERPSAGAATAETVALPSGPGSIRGLADAPSVSAFRGQVTYSVPIALPAGPTGFAPSLSLQYDGGLGNGPIGIGWQLELPRIVRSTRHGVPVYVDPGAADGGRVDELELLGLDGGGRLVALAGGQWRVEGSGHRVRVWRTASGFEVRLPNGSLYEFDRPFGPEGADSPDSEVTPFGWLLTRATSIHGQEWVCEWTLDGGVPYLLSLHWGPESGGTRRYRASFDYENRNDAVVSYRRGYREVTRRRLAGVTVTVASGGEHERLRRYMLTYDAGGATPNGQPGVALSRLTGVRMTGTDGTTEAPPLTFEYGGTWAPRLIEPEDTADWTLEQRGTTLADIDGDGVSDLARFDLGERTWKRGHIDRFGPATPLPGGGLRHLSDLRFMDLTGDGVAEVLSVVSDEWHVLRVMPADPSSTLPDERVPHYADAGRWPGSRGVPLNHPDFAYADVDGDSRTDVLWGRAGGLAVAFMRDAGLERFSDLGPIAPNEPVIALGDPRTAVHEWNGDGLADVVFWGNSRLHVCFGRGDGTFAPPVRFEYPWGDGNFDLDAVRLADLNRDGLIDLARIGSSNVFAWLGRPTGFPKEPTATVRKPKQVHYDDVVTLADLNANGSTDLVFSGGGRIHGIDFVGVTTLGLLTTVWNGLGARHRFDWASSAEMMVEAAEWNEPWTERLPMAMPVPWQTTVHTGHAGDPDRITVYRVRDGFWDSEERVFGGFLGARTVTVAGTGQAEEERVIDTAFEAGRGASRVLRGQPVWERTTDGDGKRFAETVTLWDALPVEGLPGGDPRLRVARAVETRTLVYEGQPTPLRTRTTITHDILGQPIREVKYGREDLDGDEVVTERSYTSNDTTGVQGLVCAERVTALDGTLATYARTLYDELPSVGPDCDPTATPLCACTASKGLVRAQEGYLAPFTEPGGTPEPGRWVRLAESDYNDDGQPTRTKAGGVTRWLTYDDLGFVASESLSEPLTWTTDYHPVLDLPIAVTEPNGATAEVTYDALGRLATIAGPVFDPTEGTWGNAVQQRFTYALSGGPNGPSIAVERLEHGMAPDGLGLTFVNGLGEPTFEVTYLGTGYPLDPDAGDPPEGPWLVSGYRRHNALGLPTFHGQPFAAGADPRMNPIAAPVDLAGDSLRYDALGRVLEQRLPDTADVSDLRKSMTYGPFWVEQRYGWAQRDPSSELTTEESLAPTITASDGLVRVTTQVQDRPGSDPAIDERLAITYDPIGRVVSYDLQGGEVVHTFTHDSLGRMRVSHVPEAGIRIARFDDDGRLTTLRNPLGDETTFEYDAVGRLVRATDDTASGSFDEVFEQTYDAAAPCHAGMTTLHLLGRPARARTLQGTTILEESCHGYDPTGALAESLRTVLGRSVRTQEHNAPSGRLLHGRLSTVESGGEVLRLSTSWDYDPAGRARRLSIERGESAEPELLWEATAFDSRGGLTRERFGNGVETTYARNVLGLTTGLVTGGLPLGPPLLDLSLRHNGYGAPIAVDDAATGPLNLSASYAYDDRMRLIGAEIGGYSFNYDYDVFGNLTHRGVVDPSSPPFALTLQRGDYHYGEGNADASPGGTGPRHLTTAGSLSLSYDLAGRVKAYGAWALAWDASDRLRSVVLGAGSGERHYTYGSDGKRVVTWDEQGHVVERRFAETIVEKDNRLEITLRDGSRSVAQLNLPLDQSGPGDVPETVYQHPGVAIGPTLLTGPSGERLEQRAYEPYGVVVRTGDGSVSQSFELAPLGAGNKPTDPHTLWSDHGARWLSPETVRWLSVDPLALAPGKQPNVTPYGYGNENPILFWDPDGNAPKAILDLIDAGVITGDIWDYSGGDCKECYRTVIKSHIATFSKNGGLRELTPLGWWEKEAEYDSIVSEVRLAEQERVNKVRATVQKGAEKLRAINEVVVDLATSRGGKVDIDLSKSVGRCPGGVCPKGACFVAGTPVATKSGPKAIEEVEEGDLVLSRNDETGETDFRPVAGTFVSHDQQVIDLQVVDVEDNASTIGVTPEHPFRVVEKGWVPAGDLIPGDELFTSKGGWLRVTGSTWRVGTTTVYNFEVADFHTYFAGEAAAWVHNNCFDVVRKANKMPGDAALTNDVNEVFRRLSLYNGINPKLASERLHQIKKSMGRGGADNVVLDLTGNVYSPETGQLLGSLTAGGAKGAR